MSSNRHISVTLCLNIMSLALPNRDEIEALQKSLQGVMIPYSPPPQPKLKVAQYNQTYCRKVKSISAMDFHYFYFVSILLLLLYS